MLIAIRHFGALATPDLKNNPKATVLKQNHEIGCQYIVCEDFYGMFTQCGNRAMGQTSRLIPSPAYYQLPEEAILETGTGLE